MIVYYRERSHHVRKIKEKTHSLFDMSELIHHSASASQEGVRCTSRDDRDRDEEGGKDRDGK